MRKFLLLAALVCLLGACATPNIGKDYVLDEKSGKGVVVGSITYAGGYSGYRVSYRQMPNGPRGFFETGKGVVLIPYFPKGDFEDQELKGNLFVAELPPGEYEMFTWTISSGPATVTASVPFSVSFRVEPGKAVYLGNFEFTQTASFGLTVTGAALTYRESAERDMAVFRRKYPRLSEVPVSSSIERGAIYYQLGGEYRTTIVIPINIPVQ